MDLAMIRGHFTLALPESLLHEAKVLAIRRGGLFSLEQAHEMC